MTTYQLDLLITIKSVSNLREHWARKYKREAKQRMIVRANLNRIVSIIIPDSVTLIRNESRMLDTDNLAIAFKHIRDEIANHFNVRDDPKGPIEWSYGQEKTKSRKISYISIVFEWRD